MDGDPLTQHGQVRPGDVVVPRHHRALKPWALNQLVASMKEHGYNIAYPIVLDGGNCLVDGRHRIAAALELGIDLVPFIRKLEGASSIRFGLQCNADGQLSQPDDVFDLADLCHGLARDGWSGQRIAEELGWSETRVTRYSAIKSSLHIRAWDLARAQLPNNEVLATEEAEEPGNRELPIGNWRESHFRALLGHLGCTACDRPAMREQVASVREVLARLRQGGKVTAKWIESSVARRHAWHLELARHMAGALARDVGVQDRVRLLRAVRSDVFGEAREEANWDKFVEAVARLNERALGVRLYHDDALKRIPLFKDGSIALVIADPPYNVTEHSWDRIGSDDEYLEWTRKWLSALRPKLAPDYHLFLFCSSHYQARIEALLVEDGWPLKSRVIWSHRNLSMGRDVSDKFIESWDMVFHCGNHPLNWKPQWGEERFAVQEHASPQSNFKSDRKLHPTPKPVSLIELLVSIGSKPGDTVLDPFAGGGTTGQACSSIGQRRCVLIEREEEFVSAIERRLNIRRAREDADV